MSAFISFLQLLRTDFSDDEQIIIACPSQEQISVLILTFENVLTRDQKFELKQ